MNQKRFASRALWELVNSLKLPLLQGKDKNSYAYCSLFLFWFAASGGTSCSPSDSSDLANSKLWLTDLDWSGEANQLKEAAISKPGNYTIELAYKILRRLRLVDQQVGNVLVLVLFGAAA